MADVDPLVYQHVTRMTLSALPPGHIDRDVFSVHVECRDLAKGRWAVVRLSKCLNRDGEWVHEWQPSSRTKKWLKQHRFTYDEALAMASRAVLALRSNGHVVRDGEVVRADTVR